jgi:hypothetical protein
MAIVVAVAEVLDYRAVGTEYDQEKYCTPDGIRVRAATLKGWVKVVR